jgi:hypothetical protein
MSLQMHWYFELKSRYNRVEVPVEIVPNEAISDACLEALEQLPDILGQVDIYLVVLRLFSFNGVDKTPQSMWGENRLASCFQVNLLFGIFLAGNKRFLVCTQRVGLG